MSAQKMQELANWGKSAVAFRASEVQLIVMSDVEKTFSYIGTIAEARAAAERMIQTAEQLIIVSDIADALK